MNKYMAMGAVIVFFYGLAGAAQADDEPRLNGGELPIVQPLGNSGYFGGASASLEGNTSLKGKTQIALSVDIGKQSTCGTDPWSCFNGVDDEPAGPPSVDVGIFDVFAYNSNPYDGCGCSGF